MKKTFFLLAFILPVCSVFAQTNPNPFIPGTGEENYAKIIDEGNDNLAKAIQTGFDNEAFIKQTNDDNTAIIRQTNLLPDDPNFVYARVLQSGEDNEAYVTQDHKGDDKHGLMEAYINQSGDDNVARQWQGPGNKTGQETFAIINQIGDDNVATQKQKGYLNNMYINQLGDDGIAYQLQDNGVMGSLTRIYQADNKIENEAYQTQTSTGGDYGTSLEAHANQTGSKNKSTQYQDGFVNLARVNQSGNENTARQDQLGKLNLATIKQESRGNTARQNQSYTEGVRLSGNRATNYATILQTTGKENIAHQTQTVSKNTDAGFIGNWGSIHQDGMENEAYQTQTGGNNIGIVIQTGDGNVAHVVQNQSVIQP